MTTSSVDLLRKLGSGVRPDSGPGPAGASSAGGIDFNALLQKVRSGEVSSGRPVTVASGAGVELSQEQLSRLSIAADAAEASGAHTLLALVDGKALTVDIPSRSVTGGPGALSGRVATDFDAFIVVPEAGSSALRDLFAGVQPALNTSEAGGAHQTALPGLSRISNESLASLLESHQPARGA